MLIELALIFAGLLSLWIIMDNFFPSRKHPPGPFRIPILGSAYRLISIPFGETPFLVFRNLSRQYGPITYVKAGFKNAIIVNDFDVIKPLLNNDIWIDRPFNEIFAARSYDKPLGIIFVHGEGWKEMRRFSMRTLRDFGYGKQTSMQLTIDDELAKLLEKVDKVASSPNGVLQMKYLFTLPVLNILWAMVSKTRTAEDDEKMKTLIRLVDDLSKSFPMGGSIIDMYPFLRHVAPGLTGFTQGLKNVHGIQEYFGEVLEGRRKEGAYKDESRDYIDTFMKEMDRHKEQNITPNHYTDEQFITTITDLFEGGSETSSNTLEFAVYFAMKNPQVVRKVQEEIDRVVGRNRLPTTLDRPEMPYTEATLMEVQRMGNVLALTARCPTEDTVLNGYEIQKGTIAIISIYNVHMDKKFWGDPWTFRPERFLTKDMAIDSVKASHVIPFGAGKRVCLGEQMARTTLFTYFTALLQSYNFSEVPGDITNGIGKEGDLHPESTWFKKFVHVGFTLGPHPYKTKVSKRQ